MQPLVLITIFHLLIPDFANCSPSSTALIEQEVTTFKKGFFKGDQGEFKELFLDGRIRHQNMKADGTVIPDEYAQFFFEEDIEHRWDEFQKGLKNLLELEPSNHHHGGPGVNERQIAKETIEAEAMRKVQTALDMLEVDPEQLDRLRQELDRLDQQEGKAQKQHSADGNNKESDNDGSASASPHSHGSGSGSGSFVRRNDSGNEGGSSAVGAGKSGKSTKMKKDGGGGISFFNRKKKQPASTTTTTTEAGFFKTPLMPNHQLHVMMKPVFELRKKCNTFVSKMRKLLWLRQPLNSYEQLREIMQEDGGWLRGAIHTFLKDLAEKTDIYKAIPEYAAVEREWMGLHNWYKTEKIEFLFEKQGKREKKMLERASGEYQSYEALLKAQIVELEKWVENRSSGKTKQHQLLLIPKVHIAYFTFEDMAEQKSHLDKLAREINATVDRVYGHVEALLKSKFAVDENRFKSLASQFNQLKQYDMVNAVSLLLHNELLELASTQGGHHHHDHHHHDHHHVDEHLHDPQAGHDQSTGKQKKTKKTTMTKEEIAKEEEKKKVKVAEAEFRKRKMSVLWLLGHKWLDNALHSLNAMDTTGSLGQHWNIVLLKKAKEEWDMPKEMEEHAIREQLRGDSNVRKRIFYCGMHMLFLYEQLNKAYDIDTLVGAIKDTEGTVIAANVDQHLESEMSETIEGKTMLTPTGAVLYQNAWEAQHGKTGGQKVVPTQMEKQHEVAHTEGGTKELLALEWKQNSGDSDSDLYQQHSDSDHSDSDHSDDDGYSFKPSGNDAVRGRKYGDGNGSGAGGGGAGGGGRTGFSGVIIKEIAQHEEHGDKPNYDTDNEVTNTDQSQQHVTYNEVNTKGSGRKVASPKEVFTNTTGREKTQVTWSSLVEKNQMMKSGQNNTG